MYSLTGSFHIWLTLTVIKGDNKHMLHFFPSFKTCFSVYLTSMQKNLDRTVIFTLDNWDAFWPDPWVRKMFTLFFRVNGFFMLHVFRVSGCYKILFLSTDIRFHLRLFRSRVSFPYCLMNQSVFAVFPKALNLLCKLPCWGRFRDPGLVLFIILVDIKRHDNFK